MDAPFKLSTPRPSVYEINAAIRFLCGTDLMGLTHTDPANILLFDDVRAMAEEFLWHCRRLRAGEIPSLALPTRMPRHGTYWSTERRCPRYLVENRRHHTFE